MSDRAVRVEATGDTVGDARWAALHELERRFPELDRDSVDYQVVAEGTRGLLGVGYEPARVIAVLPDPPAEAPKAQPPPRPDESPAAAQVRELVSTVVEQLGLSASVRITEAEGQIDALVSGGDLGLLIGRHGQTIDALQYLANSVMHRRGLEAEVVIDAQGYRERRERMLHEVAVTAAAEARRTGRPVELDPMTSVERKIVHLRLKELAGVTTASEGNEPNRHVVVVPDAEQS
ncbi:MAG TPA: RNA-binding cell elongation regulator Jag/EloR [Gaiellales bacterium]|jgi:spoIIIJ-associated protein|nr:RNA-binding cell elongation regulator Jag/EloR [Gaiellales bacterium]